MSLERFDEIKAKLQPLGKKNINISFHNEMLWVFIPLKEIGSHRHFKNIMIRNPHLNNLFVWFFDGDRLLSSCGPTGDHYPFKSRVLYHSDFIFPIPENHQSDLKILVLLEKRNEQLNVPIHFLTQEGFLSYSLRKNLLAGFITGMCFFLFLFSFFLYYVIREKVYIYYSIYILAIFFYILSDLGYTFMYLFPNYPEFADFSRPLAITLASPVYLLFILKMLEIEKHIPLYERRSIQYLLFYVLLSVLSLFVINDTGIIRSGLVWLMQVSQNIISLIILAAAIAAYRRKIPYAGYFIIATMVLMASFLIYIFLLSGSIEDTFITRNIINTGFTTEICILAFVLVLRFKQYKEQSEQLLRKISIRQEQIFKSISNYQEKEMLRYSSLLHDSVGAKLSAIRLNLESIQHKKTGIVHLQQSIIEIADLADDVRQFSHTLSPVLLQKKGLIKAVNEMTEMINRNNKLYIQFESIGTLQKVNFQYELLLYNIIQELVQNVIKHAEASEVIVQLILEKELIYLFIEDNGKGFDISCNNEGLGFSQIKQLITFVNGSFTVNSDTGKGCKITLEFPVLQDGSNNTLPFR